MKACWLIITVAALLCFSSRLILTTEALTTEALSTQAPVTSAQKTDALAPEALAKKSGCLRCHSIDKWIIGPPYQEIAKRYKDDPRARTTLIDKVKKGGKGNWIEGGVPMPPHSARVSAAETERLVDWVLSLKDNEN